MFKLVVLSALLAVAAARPGLYESSPIVYSAPLVQEHGYANVGSIVKSVPTAVSHQSSTVVHDHAHYVEPIVAPVVKTYVSPVVKEYHSAPIISAYAAPLVKSIEAPLLSAYAPSHYTYAAAHSPISYASAW